MLLIDMLKNELIKELRDHGSLEGKFPFTLFYNDFHLTLSKELDVPHIEYIENFLNGASNQGMVYQSFLNALFDRYRKKIINPVRKNAVEIAVN